MELARRTNSSNYFYLCVLDIVDAKSQGYDRLTYTILYQR